MGAPGNPREWFLLVALLLCAGCAHVSDPVQQALDSNRLAGTEQARAGAHVEVVRMGLGMLGPYVVEQGKSLLDAVSQYAAKAAEAQAAAVAANEQQRMDIEAVGQALERSDAKYAALDAKWYVRWGRRLEFAFWAFIIAYGLLGIGGAVLTGFGLPGFSVGKFVINLLPVGNWAAALSRWIERRRMQKTATIAGSLRI